MEARDAMNAIRKTLNEIGVAMDYGRSAKAFDVYVNSDLEGNVRALGSALAGEVQKLALKQRERSRARPSTVR